MSKKFFSRKYSKIFAMNSLCEISNESSVNKNQLIIHTPNGIYIGKLKHQANYENLEFQETDDSITLFTKLYLTSLDNFFSSDESKEIPEVEENPVSITLENVELITSGRKINMPFVEIFVDQIVGFSIGSYEE